MVFISPFRFDNEGCDIFLCQPPLCHRPTNLKANPYFFVRSWGGSSSLERADRGPGVEKRFERKVFWPIRSCLSLFQFFGKRQEKEEWSGRRRRKGWWRISDLAFQLHESNLFRGDKEGTFHKRNRGRNSRCCKKIFFRWISPSFKAAIHASVFPSHSNEPLLVLWVLEFLPTAFAPPLARGVTSWVRTVALNQSSPSRKIHISFSNKSVQSQRGTCRLDLCL